MPLGDRPIPAAAPASEAIIQFESSAVGSDTGPKGAKAAFRCGVEMIACSKKCKKVAKFAYLLKKNNEN